MTTVTVDLEDLKSLVYGTGAIKEIEAVILRAKRDPFSAPHMTATHDRMAKAVLHAERSARSGETATPWDGPLDIDEYGLLLRIGDKKDPVTRISPTADVSKVVNSLAAKGMIEIGECVFAVIWANASQPSDLVSDPLWRAVRITPRGRAKLEEMGRGKE